jgi:hypothetical protein
MLWHLTRGCIAGVAMLLVSAQVAPAMPPAPGAVDGRAPGLVVPVHGCHFDCRWSSGFGWHNHSNRECRAEPCRDGPRYGGPGYGGPVYGGRRGGHDYRSCHYDCQWSPEHGWHNHSNRECRPEPCRGR